MWPPSTGKQHCRTRAGEELEFPQFSGRVLCYYCKRHLSCYLGLPRTCEHPSYVWVISFLRSSTSWRLKTEFTVPDSFTARTQSWDLHSAGRGTQARPQIGRKCPGKGRATGKWFWGGWWSDLTSSNKFLFYVSLLESVLLFATVTLDCYDAASALACFLIALFH